MIKLIAGMCLTVITFCAVAFRTDHTVTGIVQDDAGNPVPYASVLEKGSVNSTVTQTNGSFSLKVSTTNSILVISAVGYISIEVKASKASLVKLSRSKEILEDVVIARYQNITRKDITHGMIQGRAAGVLTTPGSSSIYGYSNKRISTDHNTEEYSKITESGFRRSTDEPLSTFSIDVDAASYSNARRYLTEGELPPPDAVRIEEMVNYFKYDYEPPVDDKPFSVTTEVANCPWNRENKLVMIGLQGKKIPMENLPASNLVFLIDVSGSMQDENKLPLVKSSLKLLVDQLREEDKISIVVYAGAAGVVLPSTSGASRTKIKDALANLEAGGSTAGGEGIKLAYKIARDNFSKEGNNRIILCTDGDFNVGISSDGEMERLVEKERESGVYLTVLGYGMGNYKDSKMQILADKGNGNHAYIDNESEAKKVLVSEFGGTLFTIAKDVKLQVEFNPSQVQGYRLIGYENRLLNKEDFNDDKKDAGELGSGHTVTAFYEIIPAGVKSSSLGNVDPLKYQTKNVTTDNSPELMTVKLRYKNPGSKKSELLDHVVQPSSKTFDAASENFRFASAVIEFGMLLRDSEFRGTSSFAHSYAIASTAKSSDYEGYRAEFVKLVQTASKLKSSNDLSKK